MASTPRKKKHRTEQAKWAAVMAQLEEVMPAVTQAWPVGSLSDQGVVEVSFTLYYDDVTFRLTRVDYMNITSTAACVLVQTPADTSPKTYSLPANTTKSVNVAQNQAPECNPDKDSIWFSCPCAFSARVKVNPVPESQAG